MQFGFSGHGEPADREVLGGAGELGDEGIAQGHALLTVLDPGTVVILRPRLDRDLGGTGKDVSLLRRAELEGARLAARPTLRPAPTAWIPAVAWGASGS